MWMIFETLVSDGRNATVSLLTIGYLPWQCPDCPVALYFTYHFTVTVLKGTYTIEESNCETICKVKCYRTVIQFTSMELLY